MMGRVVHGNRLGRTLGFPTANVRLMRRKSPVRGILAVWVLGVAETPLAAVASLGTRPTVDGKEVLLEVHIFDYHGELYGKEIEVEFVAKLRDEIKFESLDDLVVQMKVDAEQAREVLSKVRSG
jgi:riboflavin kinase/FMN adenylyltransferase